VAWVVGNQGCDSQHGLVRKRDTNARHIQIYCRPHIFWTNPIQVRKLGHDAKWQIHFENKCKQMQFCYTRLLRARTRLLRTVIANSFVECILRAKTIQLQLTGVTCQLAGSYHRHSQWRFNIDVESVQIAKTVQTNKWHQIGRKRLKLVELGVENGCKSGEVVLGLATTHLRKWHVNQIGRRDVTKASLRHIPMERQCLRWWMTARPCIHPLLWNCSHKRTL